MRRKLKMPNPSKRSSLPEKGHFDRVKIILHGSFASTGAGLAATPTGCKLANTSKRKIGNF